MRDSDNSSSVDVYITPESYEIFKDPSIIDEFKTVRNRGIKVRMVFVGRPNELFELASEYRMMGIEVKYLREKMIPRSFIVRNKATLYF